MRCAQIDSFPQNPAEPIPAGRPYSMLAHRRMVRDNGLSAVPFIRPGQSRKVSLAVQGEFPHGSGQRPIRCPLHTTAALPCLASPGPAAPRPAMDASASFPPTSCAGGGIRKLLSRVLLRACLGTHVAAQSPFRAFARPAVPTRPVSTSPHFLPSRASRSQRLALAVLVLVGASSVRFQLSAGRCRATRLSRSL